MSDYDKAALQPCPFRYPQIHAIEASLSTISDSFQPCQQASVFRSRKGQLRCSDVGLVLVVLKVGVLGMLAIVLFVLRFTCLNSGLALLNTLLLGGNHV